MDALRDNYNNNNNDKIPKKQAQPKKETTKAKFLAFASSVKTKTASATQSAVQKTKDRLSLQGQLKQARISLQKYVNPKVFKKSISEDTLIPKWVLKKAKGIVFLTVIKAGFLFSGNVGTGCVIVRKSDGSWTGPSSIGCAGVSFGFLAGASKIDYIMILPNFAAVKQFTGIGQLRIGGELQVAVGPLGRDANGSVGAGDGGFGVVYSYSHAQGLYGSVALDGNVIGVRPDSNADFYQMEDVSCKQILAGEVAPPANEDYEMIIHLLDSYCLDDHAIPVRGERVSVDELNQSEGNGLGDQAAYFQKHFGTVTSRLSAGFENFRGSMGRSYYQNVNSNSNSNSTNNNSNSNNAHAPNAPQTKKIVVVDSDNIGNN